MRQMSPILLLLLVSMTFAQGAAEGAQVLCSKIEIDKSQFAEFCAPSFIAKKSERVRAYFETRKRYLFKYLLNNNIDQDKLVGSLKGIAGRPDFKRLLSLVIPETQFADLTLVDGFYQIESAVLARKKVRIVLDNYQKNSNVAKTASRKTWLMGVT